jgi:hypothetical protein
MSSGTLLVTSATSNHTLAYARSRRCFNAAAVEAA